MTHPTDKQAQDVVEGRRTTAPVAQRIEHPVPDRKAGSSILSGRATTRTEHQERISAGMKAWWRRRRAAQGNVIPLPVETPFGEDPVAPDAAWLGG